MKFVCLLVVFLSLFSYESRAQSLYEAVYEPFDGRIVYMSGGKYGYLDSDYSVLCPPVYDKIQPFKKGLSLVRQNGLWGCVDYDLIEIVPCQYDWIYCFYENGWKFFCEKDGYLGMIDDRGNVLLDFIYDDLQGPGNGTIVISLENEKGLADLNGKVIIPPQWLSISYISDGWALVSYETDTMPDGIRYTYINTQGKLMGKEFIYASPFNDGVARVIDEYEESFYINKKGNRIKTQKWEDYSTESSENMICVRMSGKWGYISPKGKVVIRPVWDKAEPFSEDGLAVVMKDSLYGYINRKGKLIIDTVWEDAIEFIDGYAMVSEGGKWGAIDVTGKVCVPVTWNDISRHSEGYFAVSGPDGLWGFVNTEGILVVPCQYKQVELFTDGCAEVWPDDEGESIWINTEGAIICP